MTQQFAQVGTLRERFNSSDYQLLEKIGQGGFGVIYRAQQRSTGQVVAIKFLTLNVEFSFDKRQRYIERFQRETSLTSQLQHPNIVRLLDKGQCGDDLIYAVFEYVDGVTLKEQLLQSGALTAVETAEIMAQLLDALTHAHEHGVIHRDIKPANIMLTKIGAKTHAKILDFGIASLAQEARQGGYKTLTLTQETLGTPSYSAPEQLRGEPPTVKTDLYVWGLVFIECLTGQPAVSGSSLASIFHKQLSQSNVPLPATIAGHPVAGLLRRVLQKKAHERSVTAADLYRELGQINFSSLVGSLDDRYQRDSTEQLAFGQDETLVSEGLLLNTGLTERKQITALALCLTARSVTEDSLDCELVEALYQDQKNQCQDIAIRYGAHHAGTLGDTQLFYFGYPAVSDNDIRLCARASLDVVSGLNKRNAQLSAIQGIKFDLKIGMHTGLVTCYADASPEGDTPNIALQLVRMAGVDQVLCSDSSRKLLESHIQFEPVQASPLGVAGVTTPLFALAAERQLEAFGFLRGTRKGHDFFGREQEFSQLIELIGTDDPSIKGGLLAGASAARLAHVCGEAGIGKSRLLFELRSKAQRMRHYVAQCLPEHQNNALYPILNLLKYQYSLDVLEPDAAHECLKQAIGGLTQDAFDADIFDSVKDQGLIVLCSWLSLPLVAGMRPSSLTPEMQKKTLFAVLAALLLKQRDSLGIDVNGVEQWQRKLFIFEDMHWSDPTSLEFIAQFVQEPDIAGGDVFVSSSRQSLPDRLADLNFKIVAVNKLTIESTAEFIASLFDSAPLSENVLNLLVERTDGIPLFIEELVNMLQQKGLVHKLNGLIDFVSPDKVKEVPGSLRGSLQQKLDSLVTAKEAAQLAATIGREFDYDLLVAASPQGEDQIQNDLTELIEAEIVYRQRKVDGDSYIFKHALVRDAAYDSMLADSRREAHATVAECMENNFPKIVKNQPALAAHHFAEAENYSVAIKYSISAAGRSVQQSVHQEGLDNAERGLRWLELFDGDSKEILDMESRLYLVATPALMALKGYSYAGCYAYIERLEALSSSQEDAPHYYQMLFLVILFYHCRSERKKARELAERALVVAGKKNEENKIINHMQVLSQCYHADGLLLKSKVMAKKAIALYRPEIHGSSCYQYGFDALSACYSILGQVEWSLGNSNRGLICNQMALEHGRKLNHVPTIVMSLLYLSEFYLFDGDKENARLAAEELLQISERYNFGMFVALGTVCYESAAGVLDGAVQMMENYSEQCVFQSTLHMGFVAALYVEVGEKKKGYELVKSAIEKAHKVGEYSYLPKLLQLKAEISEGMDMGKTAVVSAYRDAVDTSRQYNDTMVFAASAAGLSLYYRASGDHSESVDLCRLLQEACIDGVNGPIIDKALAAVEPTVDLVG